MPTRKPAPKPKKRTPKKRAPRKPARPRRQPWYDKFLSAFAQTGNVLLSCKAAGIGRTVLYKYRASDPAFAAELKNAKRDAADVLEAEAWRRATKGTERPVFHKGKVCGALREYSDRLLIELLRANRPRKYRASAQPDPNAGESLRSLAPLLKAKRDAYVPEEPPDAS